jgi:hypothetical protein
VFPYVNTWLTNNTVEACLNQCATFGFPAAGLEYGQECCTRSITSPFVTSLTIVPFQGCGDVADETLNGGSPAPGTDCSFPCTGDPIHLCGGAERLSLYHWNGNLSVWHTPSNIGYYEVRDSIDCIVLDLDFNRIFFSSWFPVYGPCLESPYFPNHICTGCCSTYSDSWPKW